MDIRKEILEPKYIYHIFNRGINSKLVFLNQDNYKFFLSKVDKYILPYFEIYAYCLMPNHFHLMVSPKMINTESEKHANIFGLHYPDSIFSKAIAKLISSYTQAFNKVYQKSGALFESPFKRIRIDNEDYLKNLVIYIHQNPEDFKNYKFSSYRAILSNSETKLRRTEIISWFGDLDNFIFCHQNFINLKI